jgi:predicted ATPase/transcriptional regulator with GAF, ATPase, and Fis domain
MDLSGYTLTTLHQDSEFALCRARAIASPTPYPPSVLVVMPRSEHPRPDRVRMLERELAFRAELDSTWAVRPLALAQHQGRAALILEDQPGEPLERLLDNSPVGRGLSGRPSAEPALELGRFLRFAVGLAGALGEVHRQGIIHKNVKPAHVLVNAATGQVWLTGFGIASRLPRERQTPGPPETLAGTLAYMAPEQTGRMNRSIDCRSDLYALGVTLYQMLTGSVPFTAAEPIEWVHCHIARQPMPPGERVANIPSPVSAIIMKLLAKTGEERYQTAAGLKRDLQRCLAQWEAERRVDDFPLGEHDITDRLLIPEKLYGRARQVETLLAAFDRVVQSGAPEMVLVSGYSGIGKSSVVNELHRVVVPPRALFAAGKFDQHKRDIPYSTLAQAFQSLVRPLLAKSDVELGHWREALREALGPNGQLMVDLVPDLKVIIGQQPAVPELPPQDAQRRFQLVFRRFLGVFARPEHPLALFLDDLQWLDAATLDLLQDLMIQTDVRHVLLIGAYRDNEVTRAHPLTRRLEAIRNPGGTPVLEIDLAPLGREDVCQLIEDSLYCDAERATPLAQLIHEKSAGNPFFAIQFLSALVEEGLVTFDHAEARWRWDLTRIYAKGYTDNVIDLMVGKLHRLPADTQRALRHLACLGHSADSAVLAMVYDDSKEELDRDLQHAQQSGLVVRSEEAYRFLHDRVQEAAYSLISEGQRAEVHLRIGRLLAAHTPLEKREEAIFEIVNQLNRASSLITSRDEKAQLAEFNLMAGKRAKASTAYASALKYLVAGASLLSDDGWEHWPDLMFPLELYRAECEFLTAELAAAETRLTALSLRAANAVNQATVACLRIDLYTTINRSDRAVDVCLIYLRRLGIAWSPHPTEEEARGEYERMWSLLGHREIEELMDLPLMTDPEIVATLDVLTKALDPALFTDANLFSLFICRMVNLSLEHGNTDASCYAYVHVGTIAGPRFGNYKSGARFGQLGFDLVEQRGLDRFRARTYSCFGVYIIPWTKHLRTGHALIRRAFDAATAVGDLTYVAYSRHDLIGSLLASGEPLVDVQREAEQGLEFARRARFGYAVDVIMAQLALVRTLRGLTDIFGCFNGAHFDELQVERRLSSQPGLAIVECWYWVRKLQARFLARDYAAAVDASSNAQRLLWTSPSFFETAEAHFYGALSHAACCDGKFPVQYREHVDALTAHHRQLGQWAENCRENFENRALLVGAEIARIEGRELDAERLYEAAIQSARKSEFVQNEALASELAACFYAGRGFERMARAYLRDARDGYRQWGADGKVRQLEAQYPYLRDEQPSSDPTRTVLTPVDQLDLATVLKVSQAVQGETDLEKLIAAIMRLGLEHAGAERGLLILPHGDAHRIEAEARSGNETVTVDLRRTSIEAGDVPQSVLQYVLRTHGRVLLQDASAASEFADDEYLRRHHARSVLCIPLLKQTRLAGILYLENNLTSGAFTPARMALLEVLASDAAISLENARLYREISALKDQLYKENLVLRDEVDRTSMFEEIVGTSSALQPVLTRVSKVARTGSTVLITGATGTGKELVARAIHRRSPRAAKAFVSVNCAAVPRELIASELFGHEKGAFTGATQRRLGRFELAHEGTIFLDEVGELPMETQVALLRVLQEREFERVGGSVSVRVDVRVIAATNRDLQAAIDDGQFRNDLFYRLNVFPIAVPALRERADDIPLLVEYFIDRYARKAGKTIRRVNKRTLDHLRSYPWPGNVRELQNVIERSVIVCDTDEFMVDESWLSTAPARQSRVLSSTLAGHERTIIEDALRASGGRVFGPSGAAARLGIARSTLESKIRGLGIDKNRFRSR